jgi:hypothetical protein
VNFTAKLFDSGGNCLGRNHFINHIWAFCHGIPLIFAA